KADDQHPRLPANCTHPLVERVAADRVVDDIGADDLRGVAIASVNRVSSRRRPFTRATRLLPSLLSANLTVPARNSTSSRGFKSSPAALAAARIERIAQSVAQQVERQHQAEDRQSGPQRHPWRLRQEVAG